MNNLYQIVESMKNELSKKWMIEATKENFAELQAWRKTVTTELSTCFRPGHVLLSKHPSDDSFYWGDSIEYARGITELQDYKEIDLAEFREITMLKPNPISEKWYILVTAENQKCLSERRLRQKNVTCTNKQLLDIGFSLVSEHPKDNSFYFGGNIDKCEKLYQELTFEQFKKYVLKTETVEATNKNWLLRITSENIKLVNSYRNMTRIGEGRLSVGEYTYMDTEGWGKNYS